jgi:outer membrane protein OmpA-like peptidoglycan-associated protein
MKKLFEMKNLLTFGMLIVCLSNTYAQKNNYRKTFYKQDIYFDSGKDVVKNEFFTVLDSIVFYFKKDTTRGIYLVAGTDAQGNSLTNQHLSQHRSESVKKLLFSKGIAADKIHSVEVGENKPIANNNTEEGRQKNRRVSVEISKIIELGKLKGTVKDSSGPVSNAWVYSRSTVYQDSTKTSSDGKYEINVANKTNTSVSVIAQDHFIETQNIDIDISKLEPLEIKLLVPKVGQSVELKNMYFFGNEAILLPRSLPALQDLVLFLQINKNYKIEIAGHVNWPNAGKVDKNSGQFILSARRAKTVFEYCVKNGIAAERLKPVGYGNWYMRFPKATSEAHQEANRRVEIKVLSK